MELARDADKLICLMYKAYLEKRKSGQSKSDANYFGDTHTLHETFLPEQPFDDIDETVWELKRADLIIGDCGYDIIFHISLTPSAIIYMENRFKNGLTDVLNFLSTFLPIASEPIAKASDVAVKLVSKIADNQR